MSLKRVVDTRFWNQVDVMERYSSQDKLFASGRVRHEALSPPPGLSQSHICSPKGLCPNDHQRV